MGYRSGLTGFVERPQLKGLLDRRCFLALGGDIGLHLGDLGAQLDEPVGDDVWSPRLFEVGVDEHEGEAEGAELPIGQPEVLLDEREHAPQDVRVDLIDEGIDVALRTALLRAGDAAAVLRLQALVRQVHVGADLMQWIVRLVRASRPADGAPEAVRSYVKWGAGPRAAQSLVLAAKARALLHGRLAATREDVAALAAPVMRHRLLLSFAAEAEDVHADDVVAALLREVPAPGTAAG